MIRVISILYTLLLLSGCNSDETMDADKRTFGRCISCHTMQIDENHSFACTTCHRGIATATTKERAHQGLIYNPAHPSQMRRNCLGCHEEIVEALPGTIHVTLHGSTNMFRRAFAADTNVISFTDTPVTENPANKLELAEDLLRRRCFSCHLYDSGQTYPATSHGQGCAACHLSYAESQLEAHTFSSPTDMRCLSCHYGNYVGFDYYGRFEHDFNVEYRTPYTTADKHFRPYGVEYHQLSSDIHQQKGLLCIDCHSGSELMLQGPKPSCAGCHDAKELETTLPERVSRQPDSYILTSQSGSQHPLPTLAHPAHFAKGEKISCQACHAQWSFDDRGKHYLRIDTYEIEKFSALTVQGSYEIESLLTNNLDYEKDERPIAMKDALTGQYSPGIWLKGYITRRWEHVNLGRDAQGQITVVRPILDYSLSWVDEDETVQFDAVQAQVDNNGLHPYTPHTTGPAGLFYQTRIQQFLMQEKRLQKRQPESEVTTEQ